MLLVRSTCQLSSIALDRARAMQNLESCSVHTTGCSSDPPSVLHVDSMLFMTSPAHWRFKSVRIAIWGPLPACAEGKTGCAPIRTGAMPRPALRCHLCPDCTAGLCVMMALGAAATPADSVLLGGCGSLRRHHTTSSHAAAGSSAPPPRVCTASIAAWRTTTPPRLLSPAQGREEWMAPTGATGPAARHQLDPGGAARRARLSCRIPQCRPPTHGVPVLYSEQVVCWTHAGHPQSPRQSQLRTISSACPSSPPIMRAAAADRPMPPGCVSYSSSLSGRYLLE